jgi:GNAT superfamily N-acetyltransferase
MPFSFRPASLADADTVVGLVNRAFAVERFFKDGERTDLEDVRRLMGDGMFLLLEDDSQPVACVYLQVRGERAYLGLLAVDPGRQERGLGSRMMDHAEDHCRGVGCKGIDLRFVNLRTELLGFYERRGFVWSGTESAEVVKGAKLPIHFVWMCRELS